MIVDEVHAMIGDKRGSHLSLSLERLDRPACSSRGTGCGLSATQKPVELVAKFLVGNKYMRSDGASCVIIDTGHKRAMDLALVLPDSPLQAVMPNGYGRRSTRSSSS